MRPDVFFSGAYDGDGDGGDQGDGGRIGDDTRLECKICWHVYDPALGDPYWQVPPGTSFARLPDHWTCPECDGARSGFLVIDA